MSWLRRSPAIGRCGCPRFLTSPGPRVRSRAGRVCVGGAVAGTPLIDAGVWENAAAAAAAAALRRQATSEPIAFGISPAVLSAVAASARRQGARHPARGWRRCLKRRAAVLRPLFDAKAPAHTVGKTWLLSPRGRAQKRGAASPRRARPRVGAGTIIKAGHSKSTKKEMILFKLSPALSKPCRYVKRFEIFRVALLFVVAPA